MKSLQESVGEAAALNAKRKAALAAMRERDISPALKEIGRIFRQHLTGNRDLWGTRINQAIGKLQRFLPDAVEQEGLSLMRDFKIRPGELRQFDLGNHPDLHSLQPDEYAAAMKALEQLRKTIEKALPPTPKMLVADQVLTHIADMSLREGQRIWFLESSVSTDEYVAHLLHPKGKEEMGNTRERGSAIGGKFGRQFAFAKERKIPTLAHAVAYGLSPKTLNAFTAQRLAVNPTKMSSASQRDV